MGSPIMPRPMKPTGAARSAMSVPFPSRARMLPRAGAAGKRGWAGQPRAANIPDVPPWIAALSATLLMQSVASFMTQCLPVVAPLITEAAGIAPERVGNLSSLVALGTVLFLLLGGPFLARLGPVRTLQAGAAVAAVALLLAGTGSIAMLVLAALLLGVGYGPSPPAGSRILAATAPKRHQALIFSVKQAGAPLGGALAGLIAAPVASAASWPVALLVGVATGLLAAAAIQPLRAALDAERDAARSISLRDVLSPHTVAAPFAVLRSHPALPRLVALSVAFALCQGCLFSFTVTWLVEARGLSLVEAGGVFAIMQAAGVAALAMPSAASGPRGLAGEGGGAGLGIALGHGGAERRDQPLGLGQRAGARLPGYRRGWHGQRQAASIGHHVMHQADALASAASITLPCRQSRAAALRPMRRQPGQDLRRHQAAPHLGRAEAGIGRWRSRCRPRRRSRGRRRRRCPRPPRSPPAAGRIAWKRAPVRAVALPAGAPASPPGPAARRPPSGRGPRRNARRRRRSPARARWCRPSAPRAARRARATSASLIALRRCGRFSTAAPRGRRASAARASRSSRSSSNGAEDRRRARIRRYGRQDMEYAVWRNRSASASSASASWASGSRASRRGTRRCAWPACGTPRPRPPRLAAAAPGVPMLDSAEAVIAACDCLYIASPPAFHLAHAEAAFAAGKAAFLEKPLASRHAAGARLRRGGGSRRRAGRGELPDGVLPRRRTAFAWRAEGAARRASLSILTAFAAWPRLAARRASSGSRSRAGRLHAGGAVALPVPDAPAAGPAGAGGGAARFDAPGRGGDRDRRAADGGGVPVELAGGVGTTLADDHNAWTLEGPGRRDPPARLVLRRAPRRRWH
jgi:MFS family permease